MPGEFLQQFTEWLEKAGRTSSQLLAGHNAERPIIPQPRCGRCHQAGTFRPLWTLLAASRSMHWNGASWTTIMKRVIIWKSNYGLLCLCIVNEMRCSHHELFAIFVFQMNLKRVHTRWTNWLLKSHLIRHTTIMRVCGCHAWLYVCLWWVLAACMQLCSDIVMMLMLWYVLHLSERVRPRTKEQWQVLVCMRTEVNAWNSGVCKTGWLTSLLCLLWLILVWLLFFLSRMFELHVTCDTECLMLFEMWSLSYHVSSVIWMQICHTLLSQ